MARSRFRRALPAAVPLLAAASAGLLGACTGSGAGPSAAPSGTVTPAANGMQLAADKGCLGCHSTDGTRKAGPTWLGLAGSTVTLSDGRTVTADDAYLRRSITDPHEELVAGFPPAMPTFSLSSDEVDDLVAAIDQLGGTPTTGPDRGEASHRGRRPVPAWDLGPDVGTSACRARSALPEAKMPPFVDHRRTGT